MTLRQGADGPDPEPALLRILADKLPAMLAYWDADQKCRFANRAYEHWFGVKPEAMIGRGLEEFLGPLYALNRPYVEGVLRGEPQEFEREIPDPLGGPPRYSQALYIPDIAEGKVRGFCVLVADISRRKRAEEALHDVERQLRVSERLAAMATLAAGIAHEINNPLAAVLANVGFALDQLPSGELSTAAIRAALLDAEDGARRVAQIVTGMGLFARGDTTVQEPVDVDEALLRSLELTSNVFRYRARLVRDLGKVGCIEGNGAQLAHVFVNLLLNAAEALPEETAARNELRVSSRREGERIVVEIADNGCGISEEQQRHVFEPFFTTKKVGEGTGLGLAIVSGVVNALHGTITVRSKVGEGSVFRVSLPVAAETRPNAAAPASSPDGPTPRPLASPPRTGRPRLLVVDDEVVLAQALQRLLDRDYSVTTVNSGRGAIGLLCEGEPAFDIVLCDLMMPEVGGVEVYEEVTRQRPELASRFVFMTGGAFTPRGRTFLDATNIPVIDKPFDLARVRATIARIAAPGARATPEP